MAKLQKQLEKFHQNIKVDDNDVLRKKRNRIYEKVKESFSNEHKPIPETILNQGSYIYGVGIKPLSGDFDIDVGLIFNIKSSEYNAKTIREWVFKAVKDHTNNVENKGPCIRIHYKGGFHVDLVCYARYKDNSQIECFQLAHKNGPWIASDPKKIKDHIQKSRERFKNTKDSSGSDQLQRIVRYLKRWIDLKFPKESNDKPTGLAILLYCIEALTSPAYDSQNCSDDLQALIYIAEKASKSDRIIVFKPNTDENMFQKISDSGMKELISKFQQLYSTLLNARASDDLKKSCELMLKQLGDAFPVEENNTNTEQKKSALLSAISTYKNPTKPYGTT